MKIWLALIAAMLCSVDLINACPKKVTKSVDAPPKSFLIDQNTPVYFLSDEGYCKQTLESINNAKHINYMKFHKSDGDINPYTLFLKTVVVVDYKMYTEYGNQLFDRLMSFMASTEAFADKEYTYPKLKVVVTAIIIPTDNNALELMTPSYDNCLYSTSTSNKTTGMQQWLSSHKYLGDGMDYDFSLVISSATTLYTEADDVPTYTITHGAFNCRSENSPATIPPVMIVVDRVSQNRYSSVYSHFMRLVNAHRKNFMCPDGHVRYNHDESFRRNGFPDCSIANLHKEFNNSWPSCVYDTPKFLN